MPLGPRIVFCKWAGGIVPVIQNGPVHGPVHPLSRTGEHLLGESGEPSKMSILQELLNLGLVDIGSDDSRFEKLTLASSALTTRIKAEPNLLIPATLISLDDDVNEQDPMFALVESLLIAEWRTMRNTHVNRPRELLRSVIIDALAASTIGNASAAGIVWNTAASPLRHGQVRLGRGGPVIEKILKAAGETAESAAVSSARLIAATSKSSGEATTTDIVSANLASAIKDSEVLADLARSTGPQDPEGNGLENSNAHWPNAGQPWVNEFRPRMAAALSKAVNLGTSRLANSLNEQLSGSIGASINQLSEVLHNYKSIRMRLDVLWWAESLYSPSLRVGYRESSMPVAAVAAVVDLAALVPALAPASVCYVLGETVSRIARVLAPNGDQSDQSIVSYLRGVAETRMEFSDEFRRTLPDDARLPLLDLVGEASTGSDVSSAALRARAGIDGSSLISLAEFAMWLFRDLQARRLVREIQ